MGYNISSDMSQEYVEQAIVEMDSLFDIVLITEKIDEGLILLKDLLCWEYSDIVFIKKNSRNELYVNKLSEEQIKTIEKINKEDVMLYEHFLRKHESAVENYGREKMAKEVAIVAELRQTITDECNIKTVMHEAAPKIFKTKNSRADVSVVDNEADEMCLLMSLPENILLSKIRNRQLELLNSSKSFNTAK